MGVERPSCSLALLKLERSSMFSACVGTSWRTRAGGGGRSETSVLGLSPDLPPSRRASARASASPSTGGSSAPAAVRKPAGAPLCGGLAFRGRGGSSCDGTSWNRALALARAAADGPASLAPAAVAKPPKARGAAGATSALVEARSPSSKRRARASASVEMVLQARLFAQAKPTVAGAGGACEVGSAGFHSSSVAAAKARSACRSISSQGSSASTSTSTPSP